MNNAPIVFTFISHSVRIIADDSGNPWFCVTDVCDALGYSNSRDAISKHCRSKGVAKRDTLTERGMQALTYINEGNLYRLILRSRKPEAEKFEAWVCDEVLPAIRKTGRYEAALPPVPELDPDGKYINGNQLSALIGDVREAVKHLKHHPHAHRAIQTYVARSFGAQKLAMLPVDCFQQASMLLKNLRTIFIEHSVSLWSLEQRFMHQLLNDAAQD